MIDQKSPEKQLPYTFRSLRRVVGETEQDKPVLLQHLNGLLTGLWPTGSRTT